jgi:TolA-binding protein
MIGSFALLGCGQTTAGTAEPATPEANVVVCAAGTVLQGSECVPAKVDCPKSTTLEEGQCVPVVEEPAVAAVDTPAPEPASADPTFATIVDPRRARLEPRSRKLLISEIQGLESLFQSMAKDAEDRPRLMRRLAEGYVELSAAAARDGRAATDAAEVEKTRKIDIASRAAAIKYYSQLVQQYPKFCASFDANDRSKSTGCMDEPGYYLSLEYVRSGDLDKARKSLLQLIQSWPGSRFVPHAYFQFGELFMADAKTDPSKWALAEQSYLEASKYNDSPIAPAAILRLGQVYEAKQDTGSARAAYKRLLRSHPKSSAAGMVPAGMR